MRAGADLPRERRRPGGVPCGSRGSPSSSASSFEAGRRHRHGLLPALGPQRGRRPELHAAAAVRARSRSTRRWRRSTPSSSSAQRRPDARGAAEQRARRLPREAHGRASTRPRARCSAGDAAFRDRGRSRSRRAHGAPARPPRRRVERLEVASALDRVPGGLPAPPQARRGFVETRRAAARGRRRRSTGRTAEALAFGSARARGDAGAPLAARTRAAAPSASATRSSTTRKPDGRLHPAGAPRARPGAASTSSTARFREFAVLGFEYGYSVADPATLVALGGAVRRLRERRAGDHRPVHRRGRGEVGAAERRWCCCCRTAIEGQGPEHSSARIERFLQLRAARQHPGRATAPRPAQYFHLLRRQGRGAAERKPLVVFTPKSLLRAQGRVSSAAELADGPLRAGPRRHGRRSRATCAASCCAAARSTTTC